MRGPDQTFARLSELHKKPYAQRTSRPGAIKATQTTVNCCIRVLSLAHSNEALKRCCEPRATPGRSVELRATPSQFSFSRAGLLHQELLLVYCIEALLSAWASVAGWRQRVARSHSSRSRQGVHCGSARTLGQAPAAQPCQHCDGAIPGSGPSREALSLPTQGRALGQSSHSISICGSTSLSK